MNQTNYNLDYPEQFIRPVMVRGKFLKVANTSAPNLILLSPSTCLPEKVRYTSAIDDEVTRSWQSDTLLNLCQNTLNHQN